MAKNKRYSRQLMRFPLMVYTVFLRPLFNPYGCCRFYPSCSSYALSAFQHYGILKGCRLTVCRLLRCHPWSEGGFDPVLPNQEKF